jgi:hypothetical protein
VDSAVPPTAAGAEPAFAFVGPQGFPFPKESADRFQARFKAVWKELYGEGTGKA